MLGAIIGDIAGSRFEFANYKAKDFELLDGMCFATDDSIMTVAVCMALSECNGEFSHLGERAVKHMQRLGRQYPHAGYGGLFAFWLCSDDPKPYGSYGNGAAMRVSGCGWAASSIEEAKRLSKAVTEVTHDHPEGLKGAEATAVAIFLARSGKSKEEIKRYITENYYKIDFTLDSIRPTYRFDSTCQNTVPQAMEAFFESVDFEDAVRNAVSVGGDSDTMAAITGGIAEAYYGIERVLRRDALAYLDDPLIQAVAEFEKRYPSKII